MRITENTNFDTIRDNISRSKERMEKLQTQSASMKKLNTPSDNPVGAAKVLEIRTDKVNNDQFHMNGKMAETFLENTDHALSELSDIVARAKEIALGQSGAANSNQDTRLGVVEEVTQLYQQAVSAANRRIGDRYLFGGYKTNKAPIDLDGRYHGDDGQMMVEIGKDVYITMNVPGLEAFNTNPGKSEEAQKLYSPRAPASVGAGPHGLDSDATDASDNVNVFDELQHLRISLMTGDIEGIHDTLERLDTVHAKLVSTRSKIGSRIQGLQSASTAAEKHNITNAQLSSDFEDADMAQVMSDLNKEETVFKSALGTSRRLIQPTLLDFLK